MSQLPVQLAHQLELAPKSQSWLIEALCSERAVLGGDTLTHHALAVAAAHKARWIEPEHVLSAAEELR